mgnify:CR=1 FL=1
MNAHIPPIRKSNPHLPFGDQQTTPWYGKDILSVNQFERKFKQVFQVSPVKFLTGYQYHISEKSISLDEKIEIIKRAIDTDSKLKITYLKPNDEKSERTIQPMEVGEMEYNRVKYMGVNAYCFTRKETRVFRIDRILEIEEL